MAGANGVRAQSTLSVAVEARNTNAVRGNETTVRGTSTRIC